MKYRLIPVILAVTLVFSGCSASDNNNENNPNNTLSNIGNSNNISSSGSNGTPVETDFSQTADDMFSNRDTESSYDAGSITITLNGSSASCSSDKVLIDGNKITITDEGTYIISGTLEDGMIIVNAEESDKPQLVFNNVTITSATSAPIYILEADKVFITLADGSSNTLSNGGTYTAIDENNIDGVVYSKQDLTFNGTGSLTINAPAGHGIVCKDDLVFTGGTYTITSASHGIDANDSVRVSDGIFTIDTGKDGIHVENSDNAEKGFVYINGGTFNIEAEGDGIDAGYYIQIEDGTFTMLCGGGYENGAQHSSENWGNMGGGKPGNMGTGRPGGRSSGTSSDAATDSIGTAGTTTTTTEDSSTSMKGIKANSSILINGGTFTIDSADDSIHSNLSVYINNGSFQIASGDDGVHAEEALTVTGGEFNITESYEGLEALNITISGGSITLKSTDDGINAAGGTDSSGTGGRDQMFGGGMMGGMSANSNGTILISGGTIFMYAQGDGIDSNGSLEITGGTTIVTGPTSGDTSVLDYDTTATITGGTFIGAGASSMAQTFSSSTQGVLAFQVSGSGNSEIKLVDASGNVLLSYTPENNFNYVVLSSPEMVTGDSYTVYVGTQSGSLTAK